MNDYFFSIDEQIFYRISIIYLIVLYAVRTLKIPEKVRIIIEVILIVIAVVTLVICIHDLIIFIKFIFSII